MSYKTPLLTLFIFLLTIATAETLLRVPSIQDELPIPDWRTGYDPLEERLHLLDQSQREHGKPDCIFLGSSSVETDINPAVFEAAYQSRTGEPINCYNFGIGAMTGSSAGIIGERLIQQYHPDWLIFGTSAIDYDNRDVGIEHAFPSTAWARYLRGDFNLTGWLVDQSQTYRYLNAIPDELGIHPRETPFIDPDLYKRVDGYAPLVDFRDFEAQEAGADFTAPDVAGFHDLVEAAQDSDTRLLILEMPIYVTSSPAYADASPAGQAAFNSQIIDYARQQNIPAWTTHQRIFMDDPYWRDTFHMHLSGSLMFSQWLGEQFGEAVKRDEFAAPPLELELSFEPFTTQLGLSPEHYAEYEHVRDNFDLLPANAVIFDPSENLYHRHELQTFIGLYIEWTKGLSEETRQNLYRFMVLLDRVQNDIPDEQVAAWRVSLSPDDLTGIDYLFIPSAWYSFLSDPASFDAQYTLLARIDDPTRDGVWYGIYKVN